MRAIACTVEKRPVTDWNVSLRNFIGQPHYEQMIMLRKAQKFVKRYGTAEYDQQHAASLLAAQSGHGDHFQMLLDADAKAQRRHEIADSLMALLKAGAVVQRRLKAAASVIARWKEDIYVLIAE